MKKMKKQYVIYWKHPEDEEYNIIFVDSIRETVTYIKSLLDKRMHALTEGYVLLDNLKISQFWW